MAGQLVLGVLVLGGLLCANAARGTDHPGQLYFLGEAAAGSGAQHTAALAQVSRRQLAEAQPVMNKEPKCGERIALLHKLNHAHPHFMAYAYKAKQQIEECDSYYRVIFTLQFDLDQLNPHVWEHELANGQVMAVKELVGEDHVYVYGNKEYTALYGKAWSKLRDKGEFGWMHGDAPEVMWWRYHGNTLPKGIDRVWVIEADVAWTGDLYSILITFPHDGEFLCSVVDYPNNITAPMDWGHRWERNWMAEDQIRRCYIFVCRYDPRLLQVALDEALKGHLQYSEITAPTLCEGFHPDWCKVQIFNIHDEIVGKRASDKLPLFDWWTWIDPQTWKGIYDSYKPKTRGFLYHKVRWLRRLLRAGDSPAEQ